MRYCIVGAGFSGAVVGRALAESGQKVLVVDERMHVAGNCHTERDYNTDILVHVYGPHIFHTSNQRVWNYIRNFGDMRPYNHRVKAVAGGNVYSLPINLLTINQFFGTSMNPGEAKEFIKAKATYIENPSNFEEQALTMIGPELYHAFFRGYTRKQWGIEPNMLPASILRRLPLRFNYDDNYFAHQFQAIPSCGYTEIVKQILKVENLELRLGARFEDIDERFKCIIYTGPIDRYFNYCYGRLGYRTLDFHVIRCQGDYQGAAVINYCDDDVEHTRITEHKYFAPWESDRFDSTICYQEFSRDCTINDIPYYPIRQANEEATLQKYVALAQRSAGVTFLGRLGSYRYLDMDVTIGEALDAADAILECIRAGRDVPRFFVAPLP